MKKLVDLRNQKGLSQIELAERLGVSRQSVSKWETGQALPSAENLKALSKLYNVSLDWLMNDEEYTAKTEVTILTEKSNEPEPKRFGKKILIGGITLVAVVLCIFLFLRLQQKNNHWDLEDLTGESVYVAPDHTFSLK